LIETICGNIRDILLLIFSFREKTGLVRKDIIDWMIELRNRGKRDAQGATVSE
jgi:hypothetical protein